jgi:cobalt-zinc-cadmium efflux system outer membrane protein
VLSPAGAADVAAPDPGGPGELLTLDQVRARVVEANPGLAASALRVEAAAGAVQQAGRLPNPTMELEAENLGLDLPATGQAETTLLLGQTIETGGKRQLRVAAARAGERVAALDREALLRELRAGTDRALVDLLADQQRLSIARDDVDTATSVVQTVRHLVEAGEVSPIELPRASAELALVRAALGRAEARVEGAAVRLAALWGGSGSPRVAGELADVVRPPLQPGLEPGLAGLPQVARWTAEGEHADALASGVAREALPDLELRLGVRRLGETGDRSLVVATSVSLPLWDRRRGAAAEARALAAATRREREAALADVRAGLRAARIELASAEHEVELVAGEVLPRAEEVFEAVSAGYALGELPLLDLLDAHRWLMAARARLVDAHERRALACIELVRLLPSESPERGGDA